VVNDVARDGYTIPGFTALAKQRVTHAAQVLRQTHCTLNRVLTNVEQAMRRGGYAGPPTSIAQVPNAFHTASADLSQAPAPLRARRNPQVAQPPEFNQRTLRPPAIEGLLMPANDGGHEAHTNRNSGRHIAYGSTHGLPATNGVPWSSTAVPFLLHASTTYRGVSYMSAEHLLTPWLFPRDSGGFVHPVARTRRAIPPPVNLGSDDDMESHTEGSDMEVDDDEDDNLRQPRLARGDEPMDAAMDENGLPLFANTCSEAHYRRIRLNSVNPKWGMSPVYLYYTYQHKIKAQMHGLQPRYADASIANLCDRETYHRLNAHMSPETPALISALGGNAAAKKLLGTDEVFTNAMPAAVEGSKRFWQLRLHELFAMCMLHGVPRFFLTLTCAETDSSDYSTALDGVHHTHSPLAATRHYLHRCAQAGSIERTLPECSHVPRWGAGHAQHHVTNIPRVGDNLMTGC